MDGFSKDGRKLRPRKTAAGAARSEKVDFSSESGSRPYGERRSFSDHKPYGNRPYGERKPYGDRPQRPYGEHKPYGDRHSFSDSKPRGERSYGERPAKPRKGGKRGPNPAANEGIKRMINRRPRVDQPYDGPAYEPEVVKNEIRLNRFMAKSGVCSRREAKTNPLLSWYSSRSSKVKPIGLSKSR